METANAVLVALRRIIRATDFSAKYLARESELTTSQLLVLQLLEPGREMKIGDIAKNMNLNQATVTTIIDRLEERGLVKRNKGKQDRRQVFVDLTVHGSEVLEQAPKLLQAVFLENFGKLADWEQTYILSALERVASLMNATFLDASPVLDIGAVDRQAEKQARLAAPPDP
ncbi:MAG: MarR family transcriptional regulator [Proteobacteria bacterium]|nr:MarR family transcriptional regulator [Pseudomonadota bacterium]